LVLRPLGPGDAAEHLAGQDAAQVAAFELPRWSTFADVSAAIERWRASWAAGGPTRNFGVWDAASGALAGNVEVTTVGYRLVNLSYTVFPAWRRRGVATRASRLALGYGAGALGATRATIGALVENEASLGVIRALGAEGTGTRPSSTGRTLATFTMSLDGSLADRARRVPDWRAFAALEHRGPAVLAALVEAGDLTAWASVGTVSPGGPPLVPPTASLAGALAAPPVGYRARRLAFPEADAAVVVVAPAVAGPAEALDDRAHAFAAAYLGAAPRTAPAHAPVGRDGRPSGSP
jgi:RimJ/RimL family protein N-acetyltransferase